MKCLVFTVFCTSSANRSVPALKLIPMGNPRPPAFVTNASPLTAQRSELSSVKTFLRRELPSWRGFLYDNPKAGDRPSLALAWRFGGITVGGDSAEMTLEFRERRNNTSDIGHAM